MSVTWRLKGYVTGEDGELVQKQFTEEELQKIKERIEEKMDKYKKKISVKLVAPQVEGRFKRFRRFFRKLLGRTVEETHLSYTYHYKKGVTFHYRLFTDGRCLLTLPKDWKWQRRKGGDYTLKLASIFRVFFSLTGINSALFREELRYKGDKNEVAKKLGKLIKREGGEKR